jgi:ectoine hydroxylase-related dioxygenase (phytanoyl-CoA dioxygenase family)
VDTFFSTHKLWLYLDDVNTENGPLVYVPGSHTLSRHRLRRDYWESRAANSVSRRIGPEELEARGLARTAMTCAANTLVVVDTCGYHCRSRGEPGQTRRALHMSFRFNPFAPHALRPGEGLTERSPRAARLLELAVKGQ